MQAHVRLSSVSTMLDDAQSLISREIGDLMTIATFSKEMIFGFGTVAYLLAAVACLLAARRSRSEISPSL